MRTATTISAGSCSPPAHNQNVLGQCAQVSPAATVQTVEQCIRLAMKRRA
jgi:hypothetical protein